MANKSDDFTYMVAFLSVCGIILYPGWISLHEIYNILYHKECNRNNPFYKKFKEPIPILFWKLDFDTIFTVIKNWKWADIYLIKFQNFSIKAKSIFMRIRYQFFEEKYLLIQKFEEEFLPEIYMKNIGQIYQNLKAKEIRKVLIDFRNFKIGTATNGLINDFDEKIENIIKFRKEINQKQQTGKDIVLVFWVDKPLPTAIASVFINNFTNKNYHYCSTEEKILEIINCNPDFNIGDKIDNLANEVNIIY